MLYAKFGMLELWGSLVIPTMRSLVLHRRNRVEAWSYPSLCKLASSSSVVGRHRLKECSALSRIETYPASRYSDRR